MAVHQTEGSTALTIFQRMHPTLRRISRLDPDVYRLDHKEIGQAGENRFAPRPELGSFVARPGSTSSRYSV
jgi:hypothetical protein